MTVEHVRRTMWTWLPLAALAAAGGGGFALDFFRGRYDSAPAIFANPTAEQARQYNDARLAALDFSVGVDTGVAGAIMAAAFGAALGFACGTPARGFVGLLVGAAVGGGLAYQGGVYGSRFYAVESTSGRSGGLFRAILMQLTFWIPVGVAVAVAALSGIKVRSLSRRVSLGSLVGALVGACLVPIANTLVLLGTGQDTKDRLPPASLVYCLTMAAVGAAMIATGMLIGTRAPPSNAGG